MNDAFLSMIHRAAQLTRSGDLQGATESIQAALAGSSPSAAAATPDAQGDVIDVEAREVRTEGAAGVGADPDPAADAVEGEFVAGAFTHATAGTRQYKLFVPGGRDGQTGAPLVVMLHGCKQDPDDFAAGTRMNEAAQRAGCFVLYPAQDRRMNPLGCWNWFKRSHQQRGRGEPALLAEMTREVVRRHGIDPRRVYVAGLSAGGAMASILGHAYPDLFAAVGVHSGLPTGSATDLGSALEAMKSGAAPGKARVAPPTIVFHGDEDKTVHPVNSEQIAAAMAGEGAPQVERARSGAGRRYTREVHRDAEGRVVAEHWVVHGSGHAWSGGSVAGSFTDPQGPDATAQMLRFFLERRLGSAA